MLDVKTLTLAKQYTDAALAGGASIQGKNCIISSIVPIEGGSRVTFQWTLDNGTVETETMDVMNGIDGQDGRDGTNGQNGRDGADGQDGQDGVGITSISFKNQDAEGNYVYTVALSDGSSYDITCPKGDDVKTYDTMPETATLQAMSNGTIFKTLGFYTKGDGNGGYYKITTSYERGSLTIKNDSPKKFMMALDDDCNPCSLVIPVCRYGVRPYPVGTAIDFSNINANDTYATYNSAVMAAIYNPAFGAVFRFPAGRFFFEDTINMTTCQTSIKGEDTPSIRESNFINSNYISGTTLYFPFLTNEGIGIRLNFGNIENVTVVGNLNTYNFSIDRTKTISAPNEVVNETIAQASGEDVKCVGIYKTAQGYVNNVLVAGFYTGLSTETANIYMHNIYGRQCHTAFKIKGDTKCIGVYGWNVHTLAEVSKSITSLTTVRVDSCVNAINLLNGKDIVITDLDGDYCTESLIKVGDGQDWNTVNYCFLNGIHGRCCTLKSYDSTQSNPVDIRNIQDKSGYGAIRVVEKTNFKNSRIIISHAGGNNPFDASSDYVTPNVLLTFAGSNTTVDKNVFMITDSDIMTDTDLKKNFQMKSEFSNRVLNSIVDFYVTGLSVETFTKPSDIVDLVIAELPEAESEEV